MLAQSQLEEFLASTGQDVRSLVKTAIPEALRTFSEEGLSTWLKGIQIIAGSGAGLGPLVTYLGTLPATAREIGESQLAHLVRTTEQVVKEAGNRPADAMLQSLPHVARKLRDQEEFGLVLEIFADLAHAAPGAIEPVAERAGQLLDQLSAEGMRRWVLLGVQSHTGDAQSQASYFRLETADARSILRAAGEGTLFSDIERRMSLYLRALWGRDMPLRPNQAPQPKKARRPSIVEGAIRLPQAFEAFPGVGGVALYRAAAAHSAAHLAYSRVKFPLRELRPIQVALVGLIEDARVEALALREFPGLRRLWSQFHVATPTFSVTAITLMQRLSRALIDPSYEDGNPWVAKGRALFAENAGARLEDAAMSRHIGNLLGNDLGQMRVQFNFKTYVTEPLYRDDNLCLWDFGQPQGQQSDDQDVVYQAIDLERGEGEEQAETDEQKQGENAPEDAAQLLPPDAQDHTAVADALLRPIYYDEWDYLIGMERPAWCTVWEREPELGSPQMLHDIVERNSETVSRLQTVIRSMQIQQPKRLRRQLEGDKLDIDACVAATTDIRSGRTPDPRVHMRTAKTARDLAVLVLLDLSQSTNEFVPGAGASVLNLAREATALLACALEGLGDSFAIHGFDSNGRREVEYYHFKHFDEAYDDGVRARLAGMKGQLSTRMGAAIRHAGSFLRYRRVSRKLILLVTDGEPHDIDVHDKSYLMFDAKHAVDEQSRYGIATFCLSLDPKADDYVTRIFGKRNYFVLDKVSSLPKKLPSLYLRLTS